MCLAVYSPKGIDLISDKNISEAWENNPHGAGIAINFGDKIKIYKGFMDLDEFLIFVDIHRPQLKKYDILLHFRWTTSGGTQKGLTHPFPLSASNSELKATYLETENCMIHNGVLFQPKFTKNFSDTSIFCKWIKLYKPTYKEIEKKAAGDRLAFMDLKGVKLIGDWNDFENDGCFYSNTYWKNNGDPLSSWSIYDDEIDVCPHCESYDTEYIGANTTTYECMNCGVVFNPQFYIEPIKDDFDYIRNPMNQKIKDSQNDFLSDENLDEILELEFLDGTTLKRVKA